MKLISILSTAQFNLLFLQSRCMIIHFPSRQSFPIWHYSCRCEWVVGCVCLFIYMSCKWTFSMCGTWCSFLFCHVWPWCSFLFCMFFSSGAAVLLSACISHFFILPWIESCCRGASLGSDLGWFPAAEQRPWADMSGMVQNNATSQPAVSCLCVCGNRVLLFMFFNPLWMAVSAGRLDPGLSVVSQ